MYEELAQFCREMADYYQREVFCQRIIYQCAADNRRQEHLRAHYTALAMRWMRSEQRMQLLAGKL